MPSQTIDLQQASNDAKQRLAETEDLYDHPLASDPVEREKQRDLLMGPWTALDEQIVALEAVRDEQQAASVVVDDVTPAEVQQINDALAALQVVIRRTESFQAALGLVTAALGAVTTITSVGKRGHPAAAAAPASAAGRPTSAAASMAPRYVCWAPHHEDLTQAVEAAVTDGPTATAMAEAPQISITCSEGHVNVFTVR